MVENLKNPLDLAHLVKTHRKTAGAQGRKMTADTLAELAGVSRDTIFRIERGEDVSFATAMRVLRVFGLALHAGKPEAPDLYSAADYFKTDGLTP
ncbi:helix-turn-helix domain-containing protein [Limnobacter humi]|uniref:Helix-turn-helix domain-containing protein n=1 Tax=Limnobacter humi TaxID=1778671 RepID=A0ABT1WIQ8_9BURK|nr:helix-turn-helix transcriptional regulator [Limnobacter humi]MCQ8897406.1 helix-turn-helix domain-containing protein [Limnobacter humi]